MRNLPTIGAKAFIEIQQAVRNGCSLFLYQYEVIRTHAGCTTASKIPKKSLHTQNPCLFLGAAKHKQHPDQMITQTPVNGALGSLVIKYMKKN